MQNQQCEDNLNGTQLTIGDLVWAKVTGYPWWPATITEKKNSTQKLFRVDFLADNTHIFLPSRKIIPYQQGRDQYKNCRKISPHLQKALQIAQQHFQGILKPSDLVFDLLRSSARLPQQQNQQNENSNSQKTQVFARKIAEQHGKGTFHDEKDSYAQKKRRNLQKQQLMESLLDQYNLRIIPSVMTKKKVGAVLKTKQIVKQSKASESYLVARRIYKVLRGKIIRKQSRMQIATTLTRQILEEKKNRFRQLKNMLHWIKMSEGQVVERYYEQWWEYGKPDCQYREKTSDLTAIQ